MSVDKSTAPRKTRVHDDAVRETWGEGPWQNEPYDRVEWTSLAGFPCLAIRQRHGGWCGYVAVPPGHPLHGSDGAHVFVHGGVTYSGTCAGHVCHEPEPGQPDDVWWFGFDCGHSGDLVPAYRRALMALPDIAPLLDRGDVYRTEGYVAMQCEELALDLLDPNTGKPDHDQ